MKKLLSCIGLLIALSIAAQDKQAIKSAKTITIRDLKERLTVIASDEFEGREAGKRGQKLAAKYISEKFGEFGLVPPVYGSYYQTFDLKESGIGKLYFRKGEVMKMGFVDFIYNSKAETSGEEYIKVMMAGKDDNKTHNYKGKYLVYVTEKWEGLDERIRIAKEAGASGYIVMISNDKEFEMIRNRYETYLKGKTLGLAERDETNDKAIIASKGLVTWIYGKELNQIGDDEVATLIFNADYLDKPIETENVLGFLKGTEKPDELLVITAHYDHEGIKNGKIYNGADDDGSGTSVVLEMAEAFSLAASKGKGPKRSILFMLVTAEEKGLLGSEYYADNPVFPLENTIVNLNIDMVGRVDPAHKENSNYVYLIGADRLSQDLHDLSESVNRTYTNINLDYKYNAESDPNRYYYRSDHYNFAKNNIPVIFYFNGSHADYHKSTDTIEKINFEIMLKRARLIFHTAWEIANRDERITPDKLQAGQTN